MIFQEINSINFLLRTSNEEVSNSFCLTLFISARFHWKVRSFRRPNSMLNNFFTESGALKYGNPLNCKSFHTPNNTTYVSRAFTDSYSAFDCLMSTCGSHEQVLFYHSYFHEIQSSVRHLFLLWFKMDESNASKLQQKKPEEEAGTSTEKKGKLNRLKKMWDGLIQHLCPRRTRNGVNSDSSSNDIPKLTVVFDLYFVAIRPHCREVLQAVREVANMMVYSAGTPKYVRYIVQLLDPEGKLFE
ncbi:conserved hypothetical protein [Trichinella spiralis]|uniref:hypothetical protein n=1 Tax=Trichinella spiralis TaxID=6334 RepID=UPI0001EFD9BB|nr:conserved hypothetical protein [Trichinella spiralis]